MKFLYQFFISLNWFEELIGCLQALYKSRHFFSETNDHCLIVEYSKSNLHLINFILLFFFFFLINNMAKTLRQNGRTNSPIFKICITNWNKTIFKFINVKKLWVIWTVYRLFGMLPVQIILQYKLVIENISCRMQKLTIISE